MLTRGPPFHLACLPKYGKSLTHSHWLHPTGVSQTGNRSDINTKSVLSSIANQKEYCT